MFGKIEKDWLTQTSAKEKTVMIKYAAIAKIMTIYGMISVMASLLLYFVPLTFGIIPRTITNLTDKPGVLLPMQAVYFHNTTKYYYLTVMSQILGFGLSVLSYASMDVLFAAFALHSAGQMENLANRFQRMSGKNMQDFQRILKININSYCQLIR